MSNEKGNIAFQESLSHLSSSTHYHVEAWNSCIKITQMSLKEEPIKTGYGFDMYMENYDKSNISFQFNFFTYFGNWQLQSVTKYDDNIDVLTLKFEDTTYLLNKYSMGVIMNFLHSVNVFTKYITLKDKQIHEHKSAYSKFLVKVADDETSELFKYITIKE